ncbi:MAG: hypothetical protein AAFO75_01340 [Pseudomonadota bacterium]
MSLTGIKVLQWLSLRLLLHWLKLTGPVEDRFGQGGYPGWRRPSDFTKLCL